jgi:hypothetical protein
MPLIPEPSSSASVAVVTAAATFSTTLEAGKFYELASSTNCWVGRARALTFADAEFAADDTADTLLFDAPHGLTTGDGPFQLTNSGGGLPAGLSAATNYWAIVVDADEIQLATTLALALAGTEVDITTAGTGTHTMVDTDQTIHVGGAATVAGSGCMFVPAGSRVHIPGAITVSATLRTKLSILRDAADGRASLTLLAAV